MMVRASRQWWDAWYDGVCVCVQANGGAAVCWCAFVCARLRQWVCQGASRLGIPVSVGAQAVVFGCVGLQEFNRQ